MPNDRLAEVVARHLPELLELARQASAAERARWVAQDHERVAWLEAHWEEFVGILRGRLDSDLETLKREPHLSGLLRVLGLQVDLLSPLKQEFREVAHTQALAHFLDPTARHGLGAEPLKSFVQLLRWKQPSRDETLLRALDHATGAFVDSEQPFDLDDGRSGRTDIWMEFPRGAPSVLVLVEAKIDAPIAPGQLEQYEVATRARADALHLGADAVVLVLLDDRHYASVRPQWSQVKWRDVAIALSPHIVAEHDGARLLGMYLASILQRICGHTTIRASRRHQARLVSLLTLASRALR